MTEIIRTEAPHYCKIIVYQEETWTEAIPQLVDPSSGAPFDVSAVSFDLFVRPSFDFDTEYLLHLSTAQSGTDAIIVESPTEGLLQIVVEQDVMAALPAGEWQQFLTMTYTDASLEQEITKTIWRGPFIVLPGSRALV